ncbi:MAG: hypothetical protein AAFY33_19230 [Cyanobacteria bacterium J06643_4]
MAKSQRLEAALDQIKAIKALEVLGDAEVAALKKIVMGKLPVAVVAASKLVICHGLAQLIPEMTAAFERMLVKGEKTDPGCKAKWAIANTLYQLEKLDSELFLSGIRHVQKEPVWGGTIDTAPPLRSLCALGLVQANYPGLLNELADLLCDPEHDARAGAARAVGYSQNPAGIPLLRLKVNMGDAEPQVLSECFIALLALSEDQSPLVIEALETGIAPVQELAAIALGEARIPSAFAAIKRQWQRTRDADLRASFLLAIATLRTEASLTFLLSLIDRGSVQDAKDALMALDIYRHTQDVWQQVTKATELRGDATLVTVLNP